MGNPIRYARPRVVRHVRRYAVARPRTAEQLGALHEIEHGETACDVDWLESIGEWANERLGLGIAFPDPRLLIHANGFVMERVERLPQLGMYFDGRICWRPCSDRRRLAFALYHELAEALLDRARVRCTHPDVQLLTLMLMARRSISAAWTRELGLRGAAARLCRAHRFGERWALRMRLVLLLAQDHDDMFSIENR